MLLNAKSGRLNGATWIPSPNCDARPHPLCVNALVIHAVSLPPGEFGGHHVEDLFCNKLECDLHPYFQKIASFKVSAHFYIKRNGALIQFVSTHDRAWHAGESALNDYIAVNDFSIGIELEGDDDHPFKDAQYLQLIDLSKAILNHYPAITKSRIVGHHDIAPGRKSDPGPHFDWDRYLRCI